MLNVSDTRLARPDLWLTSTIATYGADLCAGLFIDGERYIYTIVFSPY